MDSNFLTPSTPAEKPSIKLPCPFTAQGMLQPKNLQPPPMFGPRGPTIPPKFLQRPPRPQQQNFNPTQNLRSSTNRYRKPNFQNFRHKKPNYHNNKQERNNYPSSPTLPMNFWCETCDRGFYTEAHLQQHISEHQKCGIDGCQFTGHELMVTKHIQLQHSSGLYEKIKNLQTPEEIEKWRDERRRRYPTRKNIEQRQQAQAERKKRGELLNDPKNRFAKQSDRNRNVAGGRQNDGRKVGKKQQSNKKPQKPRKRFNDTTIAVADTTNDLCKDDDEMGTFRGTLLMENYKIEIVKPAKENALSNLVGMYGSSDSDSENDDDDTVINDDDDFIISEHLIDRKKLVDGIVADAQMAEKTITTTSIEATEFSDLIECTDDEVMENEDETEDGDPPEEQPVDRIIANETPMELNKPSEIDSTVTSVSSRKRKRKNKANRLTQIESQKPKTAAASTTLLDLEKRYRNQNTMLEKLLQKDIRHERNVLLQCVRYVVENKFFGIGNENKQTDSNKEQI